MFGKRMFANSYFTGRYFPPVVSTTPVPPVPPTSGHRQPPIPKVRRPEWDDEELMFWIL